MSIQWLYDRKNLMRLHTTRMSLLSAITGIAGAAGAAAMLYARYDNTDHALVQHLPGWVPSLLSGLSIACTLLIPVVRNIAQNNVSNMLSSQPPNSPVSKA